MKQFRILWVFVLLFSSVAVFAQTKRALVIGLGRQEDPSWGKINGDKDIPFVKGMLAKAGYEDHVFTLVNENATKANIIGALAELTDSCKLGDIVYVHFSGHGQQMIDTSGDEKDGKDECWIPYDAYKQPSATYNGEKHLTDDEINEHLMNIREKIGDVGKMLVVIDACHSGDGTRGGGDDDEVVRGVADIFEMIVGKIENQLIVPFLEVESTNNEPWITISACKSGQVNAELHTPAVGKLTYFLSQIIDKGGSKTNQAIEKELYWLVNSNSPNGSQTPVMSGEYRTRNSISDILGPISK